MSKRFDPAYAQVCGYIPKNLAQQFKIACAAQETTQSDALEQMITAWLHPPQPTVVFSSLAELVNHYWRPLQLTPIPQDRLASIRDGARPTLVEQVYLGSICQNIDLVVDLTAHIPTAKEASEEIKSRYS